MRRFLAVSFLALTLAGCVAPPQSPEAPPAPVVTPPPRPTPAPPPAPLASDWNDWPFTPGQWRYRKQGDATIGRFENGERALVSLTCDRISRQVRLTGIAAAPATIRTTTLTRVLATTADAGEAVPMLFFAAKDPMLDAIAFSRGRFVIEQKGVAPLVLPPHAEIGRVIEDCRG
ncbi:MAG: hypothetical protein J0J06_01195 [Sphingomonas sp.]|uniref:hypothetical protein n=1 Tax=Sphingomonas sp. TaxID=28214 RepID=UPI001ACFB49E|nr:hypothetical protein [Sphingomonas sp.]MBN8814044.1 hypothetical protein [Sphingomonas sp.]